MSWTGIFENDLKPAFLERASGRSILCVGSLRFFELPIKNSDLSINESIPWDEALFVERPVDLVGGIDFNRTQVVCTSSESGV